MNRHHRHIVIVNVILLYCLLDPSIPSSGSGGCVKYSYYIDVCDDDGVILVLHSSSATTMVSGAKCLTQSYLTQSTIVTYPVLYFHTCICCNTYCHLSLPFTLKELHH